MSFKNFEGKLEREAQSDKYLLLQMVSESDSGRCASENAGLEWGLIVKSYIGWRGKRKKNECTQGRWPQMGVDYKIPHR